MCLSLMYFYSDQLMQFYSGADIQGADVGTEYRSVIFCTTDAQRREAEAFISQPNNSDPGENAIVTEVRPLITFYEAENYHREYYRKIRPHLIAKLFIDSKLEKLHKRFDALLKSSDIIV